MPELSVAEVIARLRQGDSPVSIAADTAPDDVRAVLYQAAPLRWIDDTWWDDVVLRRVGATTPLKELVRRGLAREVPLEPGRLILRDEVRQAQLARWDPGELRSYSRELVDACRSRNLDLDALYHLVAADPSAAPAALQARFAEALAEFDLAAAQDLLEIFERPERRALVDDRLDQLLTGLHAQLVTRADWAEDYFRSAGFLERPRFGRPLQDLLDRETPSRAVQLVARGGMGKTMLLRWWLARRCIPARAYVSRVDFDEVDAGIVIRHPWLVVLWLARQLNEQMPSRPLQELLDERRRLLPALHLGASAQTSAALQELETLDSAAVGEEVMSRYAAAVAGEPATAPIVVVLDTFEVPLLGHDLDLAPLANCLERMVDCCDRTRLAIAGRYDAATRPELAGLLQRLNTVRVEMSTFEPDEARTYLTLVREINREDLVEAILAKDDLLPFRLALYADLARQHPGLSAQEVREYDDPKLLYLIQRVLERIDDRAVKYLLRYGVIARQLDRTFLDEVMLPFVEPALARRPRGDDPARTPHRRLARAFQIDDPVDASLDADGLWQRLNAHVAKQSWVSRAQGPGEHVSFHPDVREPMRHVLEDQDVFATLNHEAAGYFRRLAGQEPTRWVRWAEESAYHLFQEKGPQAQTEWQELLDQAYAEAGSAQRGELARRLTSDRDLVEESGARPAPWFRGGPVMHAETLAEAHLEVAIALLAAQHGTPGRREITDRLSLVARIEERAGRRLVDPTRVRAVRSALDLLGGTDASLEANTVGELVALVERSPDRVLVATLVEVALRHADLFGREQLQRITAALVAGEEPPARHTLGRLHHAIAQVLFTEGDITAALEHAEGEAQVVDSHCPLLAARLLQSTGAVTAAAERMIESARMDEDPQTLASIGQILLDAEQDEPLDRLFGLLGGDPAVSARGEDREGNAVRTALARELAGQRAVRYGQLREGIGYLQAAGRYWARAGDVVRQAAVHAEAARLLLDHGRVREAEDYLPIWDTMRVFLPEPVATAFLVVRARCHDRRGDAQAAASVLAEAHRALGNRPRPELAASIAVEGLALGEVAADRVRYLGWLDDAVQEFRPSFAALPALDGLARVSRLPEEEEPARFRSLREFAHRASDVSGLEYPYDQGLRLLRVAQLARLLDRTPLATSCLRAAADRALTPATDRSLLPLRVLRVAARVGECARADELLAAVHRHQGRRHQARRPALVLAALTGWARTVEPARWAGRLGEMRQLVEALDTPTSVAVQVLALRAEAIRGGHLAEPLAGVQAEQTQLLQELGDQVALREQLAAASSPVDAGPGASGPERDRSVLTVTLREADGGIQARWTRAGIGTRTEPGGSAGARRGLGSAVRLIVGQRLAGGASELVDELVQEPSSVASEVRTLLSPPAGARSDDVRLCLSSPRLTELPWEALWPAADASRVRFRSGQDGQRRDQERIGRAQAALLRRGFDCAVDCRIGPEMRGQLARYQTQAGLWATGRLDQATERSLAMPLPGTPLRVAVLRPAEPQLHRRGRRGLRPADLLYQEVLSREDDLQVIQDSMQRDLLAPDAIGLDVGSLDVVHIQATPESLGPESLGPEVGLFFARAQTRDGDEYGSQPLTVRDLRDLVSGQGLGAGPIVVLEVPAPSSRWEAVRELLLRNAFADRLYATGLTSAVIALGPVMDGGQARDAGNLVVRALTGQDPEVRDLRELCLKLQRGRSHPGDELLGLANTAVFAEDPAVVPLAPRG